MNLFWVRNKLNKITGFVYLPLLFAIFSCATLKPQYGAETGPVAKNDSLIAESELEHRFYLIGDAGYADEPVAQSLLGVVKSKLEQEGENTSLVYLGDNIYPVGMPPGKNDKGRKEAEKSIDSQTAMAKIFDGKTYFIPGNHDWYHGIKGLEAENDYIEKKLKDNKSFLPGKGCGIDDVKISDSIMMIVVDSQWFLEDWNQYPTINDDCDIKTRDAMFTELADKLGDNPDKVIILAIHHPLMTNGAHGGNFSLKKQLFPIATNIPIPILGSFINLARKSSGYSTQDRQSQVYRELSNRIQALIEPMDNVIVVSGHDHNLQYIRHNNIHQIISGAGCKVEAARIKYPYDFSYGGTGYATLDIFSDGKAKVNFYAVKGDKEEKMFEKIWDCKPKVPIKDYPDSFPPYMEASVYPDELTDKGGLYKFLFGEHYRQIYSTKIKVPTVMIDTLYGGLTPVKAGGGKQSMSLRLADKNGKEYVMRGVRKSATRYLQKAVFTEQYMGDDLKNTLPEKMILDFYTTVHPYTNFVLDDLAESAGLYHTNPKLYYVPKQDSLKQYNEEYGDALYAIEEHPGKEHKDLASFGKPDDIESSLDLFAALRKDKKNVVDEDAYIRARLFDMLIGDWDRHSDQWRWSKYERKDSIIYRPIARDHDQAFPKYGGALLTVLLRIPAMRVMQSYDDEIRSIKWFNKTAYPLDVALIHKADKEDWLREARMLQETLTDEAIEKAFKDIPVEVQDKDIDFIKSTLKKRRAKLQDMALEYREILLKTVVVTGTDDKERFEIKRLPEGKTEITVYSHKKDKEDELLYKQTYSRSETKEIWIYGLDDDDEFNVTGTPDNPIKLRLMGGQNHDVYNVENGKRIKIYDFATKENTYNVDKRTKLRLTNDYETNSYDYKKPAFNSVASYPAAGFNPDDGLRLGASVNYIVNNFARRPFSQFHRLGATAYFSTLGYELNYRGEFITLPSRWNFAFDARYTSPTYSINYFGYGNNTPNYQDELGMDYNRIRLQTFRLAPSFYMRSRNNSFLQVQASFETIEVENSTGRFVDESGAVRNPLFEHRQYGGVNAIYSFANYDDKALPNLGMAFELCAGWNTSFDEIKKNYGFSEIFVDFAHNITADNVLVFLSRARAQFRLANGFEFYQAATIGGDTELRGYRDERFTGKHAFYQSSDLRLTLGKWKNSFVPVTMGIKAGYDYGRVWTPGSHSNKWHQSVGGGLWISGLNIVTANILYFKGSDPGRLSVTLMFGL